jgi:hypothetical protein
VNGNVQETRARALDNDKLSNLYATRAEFVRKIEKMHRFVGHSLPRGSLASVHAGCGTESAGIGICGA